uniref:Uncharacterized protein n=1 Tax=Trichogramma kaykai TaxID=54128 RepID=A0ABD2WPZ7_9HYME
MIIPQPTRCIRPEQQAIKSTSARYKYRPQYMCVIMRMTQQAYATANLRKITLQRARKTLNILNKSIKKPRA